MTRLGRLYNLEVLYTEIDSDWQGQSTSLQLNKEKQTMMDAEQLCYLRTIRAVPVKGKHWMKKKHFHVMFVSGGNIYNVLKHEIDPLHGYIMC